MSDASAVIGHLLAMQERLVKLEAEVEALKARPVAQGPAPLGDRLVLTMNRLANGNTDLRRHLDLEARALAARGLSEDDIMDLLNKGAR